MRIAWISCFVIAMSGIASGGGKKPGKDFWNILVTPKAKWVLHDPNAGTDALRKSAVVTVESYDVRTVGKAKVARLRWTHEDSEGHSTFGGGQLQPTQVAVTRDGLYLLDEAMDDAAVAVALEKKPARSSPPVAYKGTKKNGGRYLRVDGADVCIGQRPPPGSPPCEDLCESEVCFSATAGVISISGFDAPGQGIWTK